MKKSRMKSIGLSLILVLFVTALQIRCAKSGGPRFPFKERAELVECYNNFSGESAPAKLIEYLKSFVKKYPRVMEVHRAYQDLMLTLGQARFILNEYRELHEKNPDDPMFNYLYGRLVNDPSAETLYQNSLKSDPNYYWGHLGLAYYYSHDARPPKNDLAKDHLAKAIALNPNLPHGYFSLLTIYRAEKNREKTFEMLDILTKFFPDRDYLFLEYAALKFPTSQEHKRALVEKLQQIPNSALIKKALADIVVLEGKPDEALGYLESALNDVKNDAALSANIHYQMADLYAQRKDGAKVLIHLKDAAKFGLRDSAALHDNPNFGFLRENEEFKNLVKSMTPAKPAAPSAPPKKK